MKIQAEIGIEISSAIKPFVLNSNLIKVIKLDIWFHDLITPTKSDNRSWVKFTYNSSVAFKIYNCFKTAKELFER